MPRQQGEPAFAADEQLYRRLRDDWIDVNGLVTGDAIDLQATSVDRGRFVADPVQCLTDAKAHFVAVGAVAFRDIPDQFDAPPAQPYESVVVYDPDPRIDNDPHSEIRFHRPGAAKASRPVGEAMKSEIRDRLVERLRVVYRR
jgi:hypothetical protein